MFDDTLGMCNTTPVDLELKDDVEPVFSRPYTVKRVHKEMFKRKLKDY